jgi:Fe-S oxidoreductase
MPKLELGDLKKVEMLKDANLPSLIKAIDEGYQIISAIPSCVLMFKQELPLMFPDEHDLARVKENFFDPFEYLMLRVKEDRIDLKFKNSLGKVSYHAACHQRVQNIGAKTREFLNLIPDSNIDMIERCSGHDGTYAVKSESYEKAVKIARPVQRQIRENTSDYVGSDCPMAGRLITHKMETGEQPVHPLTMVRHAYGI